MQSETLIHPRSRFESHFGSILIGRRCLVYEQAHLGARPADITNAKPGGIALGDYVTIEAKCVIEAGGTEIGESTLIQAGAKIGSGAKVGKVLFDFFSHTEGMRANNRQELYHHTEVDDSPRCYHP
jgi:dynactin-6